jgi:hypothetical protein
MFEINVNDTVRGSYYGHEFTGTVTTVRPNYGYNARDLLFVAVDLHEPIFIHSATDKRTSVIFDSVIFDAVNRHGNDVSSTGPNWLKVIDLDELSDDVVAAERDAVDELRDMIADMTGNDIASHHVFVMTRPFTPGGKLRTSFEGERFDHLDELVTHIRYLCDEHGFKPAEFGVELHVALKVPTLVA